MSSNSFKRAVAARRNPEELRLPPPPRLPERLVRAFPELRQYEDEVLEWQRKTSEQMRIALSEAKEEGSNYVATFKANL
jgi:uncharacterized protein YjiS (DUF1127 family)